jgi:bacterioferritin-associated ferredoxin
MSHIDPTDTTMSASNVICFCFGISRETVLSHIRRPGSSYENLIKETGIGTKCTACRLNLEILLGDHVNFEAAGSPGLPVRKGWKIVNDQLNCAFFFVRPDMHTVLRFANPNFPLNAAAPLTAHDWRLTILDDSGNVVHRDKGLIEIGGAFTIDFSKLSGLPPYGWFTLDVLPRAEGFVGNIRPQCLLSGRGWAAAYHGQLTMFANKRRTIVVPTGEGRYQTLFPVINTSAQACDVVLAIKGTTAEFYDEARVTIPRYGARLIDLDEVFRQPPPGQLASTLATSSQPVRHFVMHKQATGSYSVDHFPNTR